MGVKLVSTSGGSVEVNPPTTASNFTQTLPARTGNIMVDGPAFSAYQSSAQTLSSATNTKIQFQTEEFDTASCFDSTTNYRFTPTVAGYYQISASMRVGAARTEITLRLYKNGSAFKDIGSDISTTSAQTNGSALIYLNGSTDYVEVYGYVGSGQTLTASAASTYFQAAMVRSA